MQLSGENIQIGLTVGSMAVSLALGWLLMTVKNAVLESQIKTQDHSAKVKEDLIAEGSKVREALLVNTAELRGNHGVLVGQFQTHIAEDRLEFKSIRETLDRIEHKGER